MLSMWPLSYCAFTISNILFLILAKPKTSKGMYIYPRLKMQINEVKCNRELQKKIILQILLKWGGGGGEYCGAIF